MSAISMRPTSASSACETAILRAAYGSATRSATITTAIARIHRTLRRAKTACTALLDFVSDSLAHGGQVRGASDRSLATIRVVIE